MAWSPTATGVPASWASARPTWLSPRRSACRPTASTRAGTCSPGGRCNPAALSLGRRPTFYEHADTSLLEAHLLGFDGDLYDQPARVRFVARLRDELKFDSVDALITQMGLDVARAGELLAPLARGAAAP